MAITNLEVNPENDMFLTTSRDKTCRLWDLQSMKSQAEIIFELKKAKSPPVANFNQSGVIFALTYQVPNPKQA